MTLLQLILFSWVATWVLTETLSPGIGYFAKLQGSAIATFAVAYANNAHRILWQTFRRWIR